VKRLAVALIRLRTTLQKLEARWAVIGGLAVSARAEPRTTRDLDVSVAVGNDEEAEQLVREMWGQGYQMLTPPLEHLETARMATAVHGQTVVTVEAMLFRPKKSSESD
jgi:hypothetical protein